MNIKKGRKQVETNHASFIGWRDRIKTMAPLEKILSQAIFKVNRFKLFIPAGCLKVMLSEKAKIFAAYNFNKFRLSVYCNRTVAGRE